jgi:acetylornithine deacetylase/succinyl-diaminopimelate desuccinylase family protein
MTGLTANERAALDALESDSVVRLLQDLIRIPSVIDVQPEQAIAEFVGEYLRGIGASVEFEEVLPQRPNVIGRIGTPGERTLLLNAHMDVVPPGNGWTRDPFAAELVDGKIYGRGATDDKGPLAAMLAATAALATSGVPLKGELVMCAVVDEENYSRGSKQLMTHLRGTMGIVGESSGGDVIIAHKGSLRPLLEVTGRAGHTSKPEAAVNAISKMARVVQAVDEFHLELRKRTHPLTGAASCAISRIHGGVQDNVIPDQCTALLDRRMIPGEREADAIAEFEALFARLHDEDPTLNVRISHLVPTTGGAAAVEPDSEVATTVQAAARDVLGREPKLTGLGGACDMVHLVDAGVPTVVFGPGDDDQAHQPDEHIEVKDLVEAAKVYLLVALRYLT